MKIVSYTELQALPAGTIFSYYEPCLFSGLHKKGPPQRCDLVEADLIAPIACNNSEGFIDQCGKAEKGEDVPLDFEYYGREGLFNEKQLYAVYSGEDIAALVRALSGNAGSEA